MQRQLEIEAGQSDAVAEMVDVRLGQGGLLVKAEVVCKQETSAGGK